MIKKPELQAATRCPNCGAIADLCRGTCDQCGKILR